MARPVARPPGGTAPDPVRDGGGAPQDTGRVVPQQLDRQLQAAAPPGQGGQHLLGVPVGDSAILAALAARPGAGTRELRSQDLQ